MSDWQEVPRVGFIPSDWAWAYFGEIIEWSQYGVTATSEPDGMYPMIRMGDLVAGRVATENLVYINLSEAELDKYRLEKDDLLVNRTNSYNLVGKTSLFDLEGDYVCASYIVRFRLNSSVVDPNFANYFFNSYLGQYNLQILATKGVSQANINPTVLKKRYAVPLPPLPEQRAIADILGTWDEAIALTEALIAALQERKKGLMQVLLTVRSGLRSLMGSGERCG
jgi:type I restriction enzyme S subunit